MTHPSYIALLNSGELLRRVALGYRALRECRLCPHDCGVNRLRGETGVCRTGKIVKIASANLHYGEEPPISGPSHETAHGASGEGRGSGTIFFSNCNLRCKFCQNYPISQLGSGSSVTPQELAEKMLSLQERGAYNINLVTPSHVVPQFLAALYIAAKGGFCLPIVYNTSGYDGIESLKLLDGVVDVYLPDIKYADDNISREYSGAPHYKEHNRAAIKEMYRQVGDLVCDDEGLAVRGLIVRHLVLPGGGAATREAMEFLAREISPETHVSLMSQYFPADRSLHHEFLKRRVSREEWADAVAALHEAGLENGWIQPEPEEE